MGADEFVPSMGPHPLDELVHELASLDRLHAFAEAVRTPGGVKRLLASLAERGLGDGGHGRASHAQFGILQVYGVGWRLQRDDCSKLR